MRRLHRALALCLAVLSPLPLAAPAQAEVMTLAGGREGGLWSRIGLGLAQAVSAGAPDITLAYVASQDGVTNAKLLSQGGIDLALVQSAELAAARAGRAPFAQALDGLTAVVNLDMAAPLHLLMRRERAAALGIESARDLAAAEELAFGLMPREGLSAEIGLALLERLELEIPAAQRQSRLVFAGLRSQLSRLAGGEIDVLVAPILLGHGAVTETAAALAPNTEGDTEGDAEGGSLVALALDAPLRSALRARFALVPATLPSTAYGFVEAPVETVASDLVLAARAASEPAEIEAVTRALFENLDRLRAVHPLLSGLTVRQLASVAKLRDAMPLHPGAAAYLEAAGLLPEAE